MRAKRRAYECKAWRPGMCVQVRCVTTVTPRILLDPAEQVALVVDANNGGAPGTPGRIRLLDLGHAAKSLREIQFDRTTLSAAVVARPDGGFNATITTKSGTTTVQLPS